MFSEWEEECKQRVGDGQIVAGTACSSLKINVCPLDRVGLHFPVSLGLGAAP